ncbi:MAG: hypothetical protein ACTSWY_11475 [Promethearchaeota archaeon]
MVDKIEELLRIKDEQIEKLAKIKDMLKGKINETKMENARLKEEIDRLNGQIQTGKMQNVDLNVESQKSTIGNAEILKMLEKNEKKIDLIFDKMEELITSRVKKESRNMPETQKYTPYTPTQTQISQKSGQQRIQYPQKPSDILKMQQTEKTETPFEHVRTRSAPKTPQPVNMIKTQIPTEPNPNKSILFQGLMMVPYPESGSIVCPKCGAQNWRKTDNKDKIISFGIYAKKYYCKTCRCEWEFE